ncbi:hypothetical protein PYW07_009246 [Mythimna separata]|uniref:Retrovirus-related Pol polyprotein from transposon TNT 1-94 n=1 Tax=Mythimna separata TaxID=271217 RepID=A0AAD8DN40_MYTSE|nr:hypothetical protein PYW07_009246 [Mythimna separata]
MENISPSSSSQPLTTVSTSHISIKKLEGVSNYQEWKFQMQLLLIDHGLWDLPSGKVPAIDEPIKDQRAYAKICLNVQPICYPHVKKSKTALEAWNNLKSAYENSGINRRLGLKRKLSQIKYNDYNSMDHYIGSIISVTQELADVGCVIEDEELAELMLIGLPVEYDSLIMAMEATNTKLNSDFVKCQLIQCEFKRNCNLPSPQSEKILVAKDKFIPTCHNCQEKGHIKPRCPRLKKNLKKDHNKNLTAGPASSTKKGSTANLVIFPKDTVLASGLCDKDSWILDSGCSSHMTNRKDWITNFSPNVKSEITTANNEKIYSDGVGNVKITIGNDVKKVISDALYVPKVAANLLSVSKMAADGYVLVFDTNKCSVYRKDNINVTGSCDVTATNVDGIYKLDNKRDCYVCMENQEPNTRTGGNTFVANTNSLELWHRRLGHLSLAGMLSLRDSLACGIAFTNNGLSPCTSCFEGKQKSKSFPLSQAHRSTTKLDLIHTDICGPMPVISWSDCRYFITFTDDFTRKSFVYFLKRKDQTTVLNTFIEFKNLVENQTDLKIKRVRSDNGSEFCNRSFANHFTQCGIIHETTVPYTPQQNGVAERLNRTLMEKSRAMLQDADLDKKYWAEAVNTACYLKNRSPTAALKNATPEELWTGSKVDLSHLRVFGSVAYALTPEQHRTKLDPKSKPYIMLGYCEHTKGYRLGDLVDGTKLIKARSVQFIETVKGIKGSCRTETNENSQNMLNTVEVIDYHCDTSPGYTHESDVDEFATPDVSSNDIDVQDSSFNEIHVQEVISSEEVGTSLHDIQQDSQVAEQNFSNSDPEIAEHSRPTRNKHPPIWFKDYEVNYFTELAFMGRNEPRTYNEAIKCDKSKEWLEAMQEEYNSLMLHGVWELVDRPKNGNIIKNKWIFKEKVDPSGNFEKFKARLVAKGFTQRYGVDYEATFAPVVRHSTLRLLFAIGVENDMDIEHIDVNTAFLNGDLHEQIYMEQPTGFAIEGQNKVCLLKKSLYGLKQASRAWNEKVHKVLVNNGYTQLKTEKCVFYKDNIIIALYVDDFFIFSSNEHQKKMLYELLNSKFNIKLLGPVTQALGMKVDRNREHGTLKLSQSEYVKNLLTKFGMDDCRKVATPMEVNFNPPKAEVIDPKLPYQELIGSLMYLAVSTRPDIAFVCSKLSQYNTCYNEVHWLAAKRVLRYLSGTTDYGLNFRRGSKKIEILSDADWAGDINDRKSYSGFVSKFGFNLINWHSHKQQNVACSSTEAEYYALGTSVKEAKFLRNFMIELNSFNLPCDTITILNDNKSTLKMVESQKYSRTKHIDVQHHFIQECVDNKLVRLCYKPSAELEADLFTKSLPKVKHNLFVKCLGLI